MEKTPKRMLVVEDDPIWQNKLKMILENEGYSVQVIAGYGDARGELLRKQFQLAIIDLKLPSRAKEFSGMALLDHAFNKGTPTIVVTGYGTRKLADEAIEEHNAFGFIDKNAFDNTRFVKLVEEAIARKQGTGIETRKQGGGNVPNSILRDIIASIIASALINSAAYMVSGFTGLLHSDPRVYVISAIVISVPLFLIIHIVRQRHRWLARRN